MKSIKTNKLIEWRRSFHQFPEIGWTEFVTTGTIINALREMDIEVKAGPHILCRESILGRDEKSVKEAIKIAKEKGVTEELLAEMDELTGCMAIIDTGIPGPIFTFRFDIDCVYVQESNDETHQPNKQGFASCRSGLMHACGHDGHTAIGLGLACWLKQNIYALQGKYKLIFQPAEEGVRGARPISDSGILDDTDYFMGMHIGCNLKKGEIALDPFDFLCTTKLDISLKGKIADAMDEPEKGNNALAGACFLVNEILATPRHGKGMTRVNIGTLIAGENRSLIPSYAKMQLEVRGQDAEITQYLFDNIKRYVDAAAVAYQLDTKIEITGEATNFRNDPEMINIMQGIINSHPELVNITLPLGGSEDVSLMIRRVQEKGGKAIFFLVGADQSDGHHKEKFDIDEDALSIGLTLFIESILSIIEIQK